MRIGTSIAVICALAMMIATFTAATATAGPAHGQSLTNSKTVVAAAKKHKITVPSNYVYNPKLGSRHDYCTDAPDTFPAPDAPNASFRGPCARHDLCYSGSTKKRTCDVTLKKNMYINCEYWYGSLNPLRYACKATAVVYLAAIILAT